MGSSMATQTERQDSRQTTLVSIPLCLQHPVDEAVIVPGAGDRTIWRFIREGRLEGVRLSCRVCMSRTALEKHTDASGTRVRGAPPHLAPRPTAAAQSVQS
jgi:hypothetical protein